MKGERSAGETLVNRSKRVDMHGKRLQVGTDGIVCDEDCEWSAGTWRGGYLLIFSYYILHIFVEWEAKKEDKRQIAEAFQFQYGVLYGQLRRYSGSALGGERFQVVI